jgi:hypothetical protein
MHPAQSSVIIIAVTGYWWSCRIGVKDDPAIRGLEDTEDPDYMEDPDYEESEDEGGDDMDVDIEDHEPGSELTDNEVTNLELPSPSPAEEDEVVKGIHPLLEPVVSEAALTIPTTTWSLAMRIDSSASNQKLSLIHKRLREVASANTAIRG